MITAAIGDYAGYTTIANVGCDTAEEEAAVAVVAAFVDANRSMKEAHFS